MMAGELREYVKTGALAIVAAAALCLTLFVGYGIGRSAGYFDAQADGYAAQIAEATTRRIDRCFAASAPSRASRDCVEAAVNADREHQRSEQDLAAQREMSQWAWWLLIATLVQIPVGLAGLLALLGTIRQGRSALEHAREVAAAELRAYVFHRKVELRHISSNVFEAVTFFENGGHTPAYEVKTGFVVVYSPFPIDRSALFENDLLDGVDYAIIGPRADRWTAVSMFLQKAFQTEISSGRACLYARISLAYRTHAGDSVEEPISEFIATGEDWLRQPMRLVVPDDFAAEAVAAPSAQSTQPG